MCPLSRRDGVCSAMPPGTLGFIILPLWSRPKPGHVRIEPWHRFSQVLYERAYPVQVQGGVGKDVR